ncbi:hypothetical protein [Vibrio phage VCPH]|nr:hypothetical protein [Vibrio phage VCPH]
MSSVDQGVPIAGMVMMMGSATIPDNFISADGQEITNKRSPMVGQNAPNWNLRDFEVVPTQVAPYDGSVTEPETDIFSITQENLPAISAEVSMSNTFTPGSGSYYSEYEESTIYHTDNVKIFGSNRWATNQDASRESGSSFSGSSAYFWKDDDNNISTFRALEHDHSVSWSHSVAHSFTNAEDHDWLGTSVFGVAPSNTTKDDTTGSTTMETNGKDTPDAVNSELTRDKIEGRWYMRIY